MDKKFNKVCVLKGGDSPERAVSLLSAEGYVAALKEKKYELMELDFTGNFNEMIAFLNEKKPDCVLNSLHGGNGENGNIPAVLNFLKIPYTHSGVLASSVAMDKYVSGLMFEKHGIRIPRRRKENWASFVENPKIQSSFVIKPVDGGSSDGVYILNDVSMLGAIEWNYGKDVLIEEYIQGIELTVGVVNDKPLEVTQIDVQSGFYDYKNKYTVGCSSHEIPARIPEDIRNEAMDAAIRAHRALGCRGISRSDFRYNNVTNELYMLELNTHPGMTPVSLVPEQAKFVGMSFSQLAQWIVEQACYDS